MIYFTADTHFSQKRTLELSKRPFSNINEMDTTIIDNWNDRITKHDIVFHLGDFGDPSMLPLLQGERILFLPGQTYDDEETVHELTMDKRIEIIEPNHVFNCLVDDEVYKLLHEPELAEESHPTCFFLYGHIHKLQMVKRNGLCVSQDAHHFYPISLEEVKFYRNAIENHYDENAFMEKLG